jgi:peptidoglycan/xylan/chitin deacetylase (PgdA/CDA1 family)
MPGAWAAQGAATCEKPVYLTFDTGHMGVAPLVADVLKRQDVRVTFFAANERTQTDGDGSLGDHWAPWWKARAAEGHEFASHTYDHVYWRADVKGTPPSFNQRRRPGRRTARNRPGARRSTAPTSRKSSDRWPAITGRSRCRCSARRAARLRRPCCRRAACGYKHVGWAPAGFLGDELPSEKFSNAKLLTQALGSIRPGDILLAHLGIWSRKDPWAPAVLEPLITGLKAKRVLLRDPAPAPHYAGWIASTLEVDEVMSG